jgi:hypothetical protein
MDAAARENFIVVPEIWDDRVASARGEYRRVLLRQECEHDGIYVARSPRPTKAQHHIQT